MTDDRPPIDDSDEELVSAYLDGEATPDERARVEADPRLLALVDSYRSVAEAVGSPVMPLDRDRRDTMVAAALAVLDEHDDEAPTADVVPLAGRRHWISRAPGLAAAAAILFLVGMGLVLSSRGADRDQSADATAGAERSTTADDLSTKESGSDPESAEDGDAGPAAAEDSETGALASPRSDPAADLGDFADEASLRQALAIAVDREQATTEGFDAEAELEPALARCADIVTATDGLLDELVAVRTATLAGEPVLVFSHTERDEPDRVVDTVTDRGSCQILFAQAR